MEYSFIIAVIPVILVVAFLVWIAKKITDGERLDMKEGVLGVVILMVAVLIMVPMISSTQVYTWDEDNGELVIQQNISGGSYAWDTYDDQIRSIVIKPGVTQIGNSAFDGATNLEYLSIPDTVTDIGTNAFGVTFEDPFGTAVTDIAGGEYAGFGDGTLYQADPDIFAYNSAGTVITGLASDSAGATSIVIPRSSGTAAITEVGTAAFDTNTVIERILTLPDHEVLIRNNAVRNCSALTEAHFGDETTLLAIFWASSIESTNIPAKMTSIQNNTFWNCASLAAIEVPSNIETIGQSAFRGCTSLTDVTLNEGLKTINSQAFYGDTAIQSFALPASVESISGPAFRDCSGVTSVSFATGFSAELADGWCPWTFFEVDGTTQIDKSQAANLAGKSFQGVYNALVEVAPGMLSLTPEQLHQVQLHTQELQDISIDPLPLQPSLQELTA